MSSQLLQPSVCYGQSQPLVKTTPIVQEVSAIPGISTRGVLGQVVVYIAPDGTRAAYMLIGVFAGNSLWVSLSGGDAFFHNLLVTGTLTVDGVSTFDNGVHISDGNALTFDGAGQIAFTGNSNIVFNGAQAGIVMQNEGSISLDHPLAGTFAYSCITPSVGIGGVVGGINYGLFATGCRVVTDSIMDGGSIRVTSDLSVGFVAGTDLGLTNTRNTTQSTGALTLLSSTANPGTNAGFLEFYIGTTPIYVPYFLNIAP